MYILIQAFRSYLCEWWGRWRWSSPWLLTGLPSPRDRCSRGSQNIPCEVGGSILFGWDRMQGFFCVLVYCKICNLYRASRQVIGRDCWQKILSPSIYWVALRLVGRDFLENIPWVPSFALAVGTSAGWLGHEASYKSKHTKTLPTSRSATQYSNVE